MNPRARQTQARMMGNSNAVFPEVIISPWIDYVAPFSVDSPALVQTVNAAKLVEAFTSRTGLSTSNGFDVKIDSIVATLTADVQTTTQPFLKMTTYDFVSAENTYPQLQAKQSRGTLNIPARVSFNWPRQYKEFSISGSNVITIANIEADGLTGSNSLAIWVHFRIRPTTSITEPPQVELNDPFFTAFQARELRIQSSIQAYHRHMYGEDEPDMADLHL